MKIIKVSVTCLIITMGICVNGFSQMRVMDTPKIKIQRLPRPPFFVRWFKDDYSSYNGITWMQYEYLYKNADASRKRIIQERKYHQKARKQALRYTMPMG